MHYQAPPISDLTPLYIDAHLLVLDKPAGLLSVPGRGEDKQDCLINRVRLDYPEALIVHRLDMATSGLMLMARNEEMQRQLSMLFEKRQIHKRYIAIVDGRPEPDAGDVELALITDWPNRPLQKVDHENGKPALTHYRLLEYSQPDHSSRIELVPHTGRTHQLRVHMKSIGHTILGDPLYGDDEVRNKAARLLLHAESLRFTHPVSRQPLHICSAPPF